MINNLKSKDEFITTASVCSEIKNEETKEIITRHQKIDEQVTMIMEDYDDNNEYIVQYSTKLNDSSTPDNIVSIIQKNIQEQETRNFDRITIDYTVNGESRAKLAIDNKDFIGLPQEIKQKLLNNSFSTFINYVMGL